MITIRRSEDRGHFNHGWLDTYHSFSFDRYYDPEQMGFRSLRVINEDRVAPGAGFPPHPHRDMEILTYVLDGALQHTDSMGNGSVIRPGEVQRMSAGTGVRHSEFNASESDPVHLLQIWLLPERTQIEPGYEQKAFSRDERTSKLRLVASRDAREGSVKIHQDAAVYSAIVPEGESLSYAPPAGRHSWIQIASGLGTVNGKPVRAGDGIAVAEEPRLEITAESELELLLFDLA